MSTLALFPGTIVEIDSTDAQCTPRDLALDLGRFGIDVCTNPRSHIVASRSCMLELGQDGLSDDWRDHTGLPLDAYCNWPFSAPMAWCERLRAHRGGWCGLGKLDPTTKWFAELLAKGPTGSRAKWAPFKMRLAFEKPGNVGSAEFPCFLAWRDWKLPKAVARRLWSARTA